MLPKDTDILMIRILCVTVEGMFPLDMYSNRLFDVG